MIRSDKGFSKSVKQIPLNVAVRENKCELNGELDWISVWNRDVILRHGTYNGRKGRNRCRDDVVMVLELC